MNLPSKLKNRGLILSGSGKINRRLVMTSEAMTGCGKSDLAFRTMPRPLLVIDLDNNLQAIESKYPSDDIVIHRVKIPPKYQSGNKAHKTRDYDLAMEIQDIYLEAVESGEFRSAFVDTNNELWELARRGLLDGGGVDFGSDKRTEYAPANAYMKSFFDVAKSKRINFLMSAQVKDEYKGANATGKKVAGGWKGMMQCSQCHVRLFKDDPDKNGNNAPVPDKFHMEILKCSYDSDLEGQVLDGEDISFATLGRLVFPISSAEDWE